VLQSRVKWWSALAAFLLGILLVLKFSVGVLLAPDDLTTVLLWVFWILLYLAFFISLSVVLAAAALLAE
jgi:hypothetical protein